jgi:hypothetical protein
MANGLVQMMWLSMAIGYMSFCCNRLLWSWVVELEVVDTFASLLDSRQSYCVPNPLPTVRSSVPPPLNLIQREHILVTINLLQQIQ